MAGGSSEDRWRRPTPTSRCHGDLRDDEPEEGEIVVPGYHSDADTEEYYNRHGCSSSDSDETISDSNNAACSVPPSYGRAATTPCSVASNSDGASASASSPAAALACPVCGKEFRSQKAVCGHMKVHAIGTHEQGIGRGKGIKRDVAAVASWGGTGKRGCSGLGDKAAASTSAESDQSMAIVVAEPMIVLQPKPLAFATPNLPSVPMASAAPIQTSVSMESASPNLSPVPVPVASAATNVSGQSSSAQPMHNAGIDAVVAGAANPPGEAVVHPHAAPPTPPAAGEQAQSILQHPTAAPPPPAAGRQNPNGYSCKECNEWFPTHQGLGGHVAAHRSREGAAAAEGMMLEEDGAVACRRNAKPEKQPHVCKVCGAAFPAGVQLGGHMRKHYAGPPIVPNKKPRLIQPPLPPPGLTLALPASAYADGASPAPAPVGAAALHGPAPAAERTPEPAPGPAVAARVLLFGIDIGMRVQKPAAQEGPSATEGQASTGGEQ